MKCENIRELMSIYIDNEINEVDKAKFEKHIAQCPQCKEEYEILKDLVLECSEIDEVELPQGFREELHNKLVEAKANKPGKLTQFMRRANWKPAAGAVAAVLILAISLNSLGSSKSFEQAQSSPSAAADDRGGYGIYSDAVENNAEMKTGAGAAGAAEEAPAAPVVPELKAMDRSGVSLTMDESMKQNQNLYSIEATPQQERKIIKNGNVSLKVTDVQARIQEITTLAEQSGGYVESSYVDNIVQPSTEITQDAKIARETTTMIANMTIKVPAEKFAGSFQKIIEMGKLVNQNSNSNDVTVQYRDIEARVANLKVQEKHLQEIMTKATTVEDTLKVEVELNRVRTEIDIMTGNLKNWDQLVEYSTIYINMTEVKEAEIEKVDVPGVWQNAQQGFINAINNIRVGIERLFVFVVSALPYILILGAGSILALLWIKKRQK
jgi:anti-sigma factor RsiW